MKALILIHTTAVPIPLKGQWGLKGMSVQLTSSGVSQNTDRGVKGQ